MKHFLFTLLICLAAIMGNAQDTKLIYFGDPMCSWCYGFSNEVSEIKNSFPDIPFEMVMGGLRPYGTETMASLKGFLKEHWEEIGHLTGQKFSYDILEQPEFIYDTEPACRAVVVMRMIAPEKELPFFKAVQKLFYSQNKDPKQLESYSDLLKEFGIDKEEFGLKWNADEFKQKTKADFQLSQEMGVRGFPSMVLKAGEQYYLLSNGYQKAEKVIQTIQSKLKN